MFNLSIIYQIWVNKYTSADELLCLCIAQRELVSFSLTEVLLQKQHITPTILALIIQISIIWTSHIYFWLVTGTGYLILGKWTDKSYGNRNVCLTTPKLPLWNGFLPSLRIPTLGREVGGGWCEGGLLVFIQHQHHDDNSVGNWSWIVVRLEV